MPGSLSVKMLSAQCIGILILTSFTIGEIKNKGWWRNAVFYQIYPRSFMDSDGDGIGDLNGITNKLQHFVDAGVGGIWLSPIYASPMVDFGYDISDYRAIDKVYGTMEDFEKLTNEAKKLGIKVIIDFVPNHTSDEHEWFIQSLNGVGKYKDYYVWREGRENNSKPPNNWLSIFSGSAWKYNASRGLWYLHQFEYRQIDLNFTNPDVREEINDVLKFWLGKGVDGFRIDAIPFVYEADKLPDEPNSNKSGVAENDHDYLDHIYTKDDIRNYDLVKSWRRVLDEWAYHHNEDEKVIMTEAYTNLPNTTKFYHYGVHVPLNFYFITDITNTSKPSQLKKVIDDWMVEVPRAGVANWVLGNHDHSRVTTRFPRRADQMTMLAMILPGVAVTYYGEEISMEDKLDISWEDTRDTVACNAGSEHYKSKSRDPSRTPFQWDNTTNAGFSTANKTWLPVNQNYKDLNLLKQKSDPESHYALYKTLTALRHKSKSLKNGKLITKVLNKEKVLAVIREVSEEYTVLLINFSNDKLQKVDIGNQTSSVDNATVIVASVGSDIAWGSSVAVSNIQLPSKASIVLHIKVNKENN